MVLEVARVVHRFRDWLVDWRPPWQLDTQRRGLVDRTLLNTVRESASARIEIEAGTGDTLSRKTHNIRTRKIATGVLQESIYSPDPILDWYGVLDLLWLWWSPGRRKQFEVQKARLHEKTMRKE
jgi:hypothetical protein